MKHGSRPRCDGSLLKHDPHLRQRLAQFVHRFGQGLGVLFGQLVVRFIAALTDFVLCQQIIHRFEFLAQIRDQRGIFLL